MVAQNGSLVLLKIGRGLSPEQYITIGGMRTTKFLLNNQIIDSSHKESGKWRQLLFDAGISSVTIAGSGIFTDAQSEIILRQHAFANKPANFLLCFGNGDILTGIFIISSYERIGNYAEEEGYNLTLESAGEILYTSKGESLAKLPTL
jgi:TP901-1 family phage major tail protein